MKLASSLLQVLEEVPDRLAPKAGQQQQAALPQYPHPSLAALFADKAPHSSSSADSSMARVGSGGGSSRLSSKHVSSPQPTQQAQQAGRKVPASDPTDSMTRSELFASSPSPPRTASGSGEADSRPGSGSAGSGASRGAPLPAPPGAAVSGLVGPSGTPRVRTADEIRQAYGRPQLSKAQVGLVCTPAKCLTALPLCCFVLYFKNMSSSWHA